MTEQGCWLQWQVLPGEMCIPTILIGMMSAAFERMFRIATKQK